MDNYESMSQNEEKRFSMRIFTVVAVASQVVGVLCVVLTAVWMGVYHGGYVWLKDQAFNFHPLFMVLGLVFFYGEAILVYRVFRGSKKMILKVVHGCIHLMVLIFAVVGLKAVWDSHNLIEKPIQNLYSLHSWIGLLTVILFALQWLFGFLVFLLPFSPPSLRRLVMPIHLFSGVCILVMALIACLTGITEKALWTLGDKYEVFVSEGILVNVLGLSLIVFVVVVLFLVVNPNYKRQPVPEDHIQLTN